MVYGWTKFVQEVSEFARAVGAAALGNAIAPRGARCDTRVVIPNFNLTCPAPVCPLLECRCPDCSLSFGAILTYVTGTALVAIVSYLVGARPEAERGRVDASARRGPKGPFDLLAPRDELERTWTPSPVRR